MTGVHFRLRAFRIRSCEETLSSLPGDSFPVIPGLALARRMSLSIGVWVLAFLVWHPSWKLPDGSQERRGTLQRSHLEWAVSLQREHDARPGCDRNSYNRIFKEQRVEHVKPFGRPSFNGPEAQSGFWLRPFDLCRTVRCCSLDSTPAGARKVLESTQLRFPSGLT